MLSKRVLAKLSPLAYYCNSGMPHGVISVFLDDWALFKPRLRRPIMAGQHPHGSPSVLSC